MAPAARTRSKRGSRRAKGRAAKSRRKANRKTRKQRTSRRQKTVDKKARKESFLLWSRVMVYSAIVNAVIIAVLMLIVFAMPAKPPPVIFASAPFKEKTEEISDHKLERTRRQHSSSTSAAAFTPVVAPAVSAVSFDPPEITVDSAATLTGAMLGYGDGTGIGDGGTGMGGGGAESGSIGGMRVKAQRLGVVLDVSGSMNEEIKAVRREIRKSFSRATVIEVTGCRLDWDGESPRFDRNEARGRVELAKTARSVNEAIEILIVAANVDSIFWFSDLNDSQTKAGTDRLSHLLGTNFGSERRPIKFYVQSVDRDASETLRGIARRSGGASKVQSYE